MNKQIFLAVLERDISLLATWVASLFLSLFLFIQVQNPTSIAPILPPTVVLIVVLPYHYMREIHKGRNDLLQRMKELLDNFESITIHSGLNYSILGITKQFWVNNKVHFKSGNKEMWKYHFDRVQNLLTSYKGAVKISLEHKEVIKSPQEFEWAIHRRLSLLFEYTQVLESFRKMAKEVEISAREIYDNYNKFIHERDELVRRLRILIEDLEKKANLKIDIQGINTFEFTKEPFAP